MSQEEANGVAVQAGTVERRIYVIRGIRVMLDSDLAELYAVTTSNFNKAVKRNLPRFPADFMFQLTETEYESLRFQIGISNEGRGGRRYLPYAFSEHGVAMLSAVLSSERAVQMSITIIRAFIRLRELSTRQKKLAARVDRLEKNQKSHASAIAVLAEEIESLKEPPPEPPKRRIGF